MARYFLLTDKIILTVIGSIFAFGFTVSSSELPKLDEILVTSRGPDRTLNCTASETTVLSSEDISTMHVTTIPELLETIASINIIERGTPGSQADITIRGSSTEGVLLLIDGVRFHDPQTAH